MTTTEGKIYITALKTLERLEIQFLWRENGEHRKSKPVKKSGGGFNDRLSGRMV